ncbi:MAG: hypothetical protein IMZ47_09885 [Firmicutes bacterium]|nr:hypothetical protein [Bacillota bacterium]
MEIIIAGPYIGELGFEIGNWIPYLASIRNKYDSMVVFARNGHQDLYPFADEFIGFDFGLETRHCDKNWMMKPFPEEVDRYTVLEEHVKQYAMSLKGHKVSLLLSNQSIRKLEFSGRVPTVLTGSKEKIKEWEQKLPLGLKVVFVVRSYTRGASKNTDPKLLNQVICELKNKVGVDCILVGQEELPFKCEARSECVDLLNQTSVSDLIAIYNLSKVVVGASTGTIHLAAACGTPHVTWVSWVGDIPAIQDRYYNSWNLNKTPIRYLLTKQITSETVVDGVLSFIDSY